MGVEVVSCIKESPMEKIAHGGECKSEAFLTRNLADVTP